jgi:hypothetical protein
MYGLGVRVWTSSNNFPSILEFMVTLLPRVFGYLLRVNLMKRFYLMIYPEKQLTWDKFPTSKCYFSSG